MFEIDINKNILNKVKISCILFSGLFTAACSGGMAAESCSEINDIIDKNIVNIAVSEQEGDSSDKSAMQQSARLAQNSNRLATIMINLQLLELNKCLPRTKPIDASIYDFYASTCYMARMKQRIAMYGSDAEEKKSTGQGVKSSCDFKSWNVKQPN